jgi:hypothetical protein
MWICSSSFNLKDSHPCLRTPTKGCLLQLSGQMTPLQKQMCRPILQFLEAVARTPTDVDLFQQRFNLKDSHPCVRTPTKICLLQLTGPMIHTESKCYSTLPNVR